MDKLEAVKYITDSVSSCDDMHKSNLFNVIKFVIDSDCYLDKSILDSLIGSKNSYQDPFFRMEIF